MPRRSALRSRFRLLATLLVAAVQLPAVIALCALTRTPIPLLLAAAVSYPYLRQLESPWHSATRHATTYAALGWWSACAVFDLLLVPLWLLGRAGAPAMIVWPAAGALALAVGVDAVAGRPRLRRLTVRIVDLPPELDGYRIGQLSDIHCGPNVPESHVARWVQRMNALGLDLVTVTGDLIAHGASHVDAVARALGGLRAKDGAFVSMGNHDYFTDGEQLVRALQGRGLDVLRNRGVVVERGGAQLYVAGVDDTWTSRDDLARALRDRPEGVPTVLLAHDPDLFPEARAHAVELTLSGHTHGGQLGVPGVRRWSLGRFASRFVAGLYRDGDSWLYVNRGAGTTGPPARLGVPPELAVITLRRA